MKWKGKYNNFIPPSVSLYFIAETSARFYFDRNYLFIVRIKTVSLPRTNSFSLLFFNFSRYHKTTPIISYPFSSELPIFSRCSSKSYPSPQPWWEDFITMRLSQQRPQGPVSITTGLCKVMLLNVTHQASFYIALFRGKCLIWLAVMLFFIIIAGRG